VITTVAEIAKEAFDSVAKEIGGVIFDGVLSDDPHGLYNQTTAAYDLRPPDPSQFNCRVLVTQTPKDGRIGSYTVGPKESVALIEGLKTSPKENMILNFSGKTKTLTFVDDILYAGQLFTVVMS
jgi:hypothetical protein